jgi:hypothetical protein
MVLRTLALGQRAKPLARSECAEDFPKERRYVAEEFFAYCMGSCRDGVPCFIVEGGRFCKMN